MRHWGFWDWVGYFCLLVAAVIMAADTGFKLSPDLAAHLPHFIEGPFWGFAPVGLVLLGTVVLLIRHWRDKPGADGGIPAAAKIPKLDWTGGHDIFDKFGNRGLLEKYAKLKSEHKAIQNEWSALYDQHLAEKTPEEADRIERERNTLMHKDRNKQMEVERVWMDVWTDIRNRLATSELVAKGFRKPVNKNPDPVLIPSEYWRFLQFTDSYSGATGEGIQYAGMMVARSN
jgi:hypothetical protein